MLFEELEYAVSTRDIDAIELALQTVKRHQGNFSNKMNFFDRVENLGKGNKTVMFETGKEADAVHAFLDVLAEHGYSIYDDDGNEILECGEWA